MLSSKKMISSPCEFDTGNEKLGAGTYNVAFVTFDDLCNIKIFIKMSGSMLNKLYSGCGWVSPKERS